MIRHSVAPKRRADSLLACVVKNRGAWFCLVKIRPPLRHVVLVVKRYCYPGVVPVIGCFHTCYAHQRKRHAFLQVVWNPGLHLRLITGRAVMSEDQVFAVNGDHRDHGRTLLRLRFGHEGAPIGGQGVRFCDWNAVLDCFPVADERCELLKHSVAPTGVRWLRLSRQQDYAGHDAY
jgi:hypothetical protein